MWNPFKKNNSQTSSQNPVQNDSQSNNAQPKDAGAAASAGVGGFAMGMMQKIAMKKLAKMSPQEQQKLVQDMLKPENKGKMLQVMEAMKKSGQISEEQYNMAKERLK